jgi:ABC-type nitrate/sulfonate/bicarbonate transport system permease component
MSAGITVAGGRRVGAESRRRLRRFDPVRVAERWRLPTLLFLLAVAGLWALLSRQYGQYLFPSPVRVVQGLVDVVRTGQVWVHASASLARIGAGFAAACLVSLLAGFLIARFRLARTVVQDVTAILNSTSVFVWIVVAMVWFGLSDLAPVFTTFMITLPVLLSNVIQGVAHVDRKLLEMARVYGWSDLDRFVHITVPGAVPYIVAGMKVAFALGLRVSVVAEIFGVRSGIGFAMNISRDTLRTDLVFVWAIVLIGVMLLIDRLLFEALTRRVESWR